MFTLVLNMATSNLLYRGTISQSVFFYRILQNITALPFFYNTKYIYEVFG